MAGAEMLAAHLAEGVTTVCRCWAVTRADGVTLGFTDHDRALAFEGVTFRPDAGLSARALVQTTGLAVDNTEAVGALSSDAITEADLMAGRYDGAEVTAWLVNWQDVAARQILFRGTLGEVTRAAGAFRAELLGLAEALNRPTGAVYQAQCGAVLGDARCGVDLTDPAFRAELPAEAVEGRAIFRFAALDGFAERWFERGRLTVLGGAGAGLSAAIKADRLSGGLREIELWEELRAAVQPGDAVRLEAGCDKRAETCRDRFANLLNFRGFPHIPGDDWITTYPRKGERNDGGSLFDAGDRFAGEGL
jgi:uncharacterized phage protein (TIGR02218 family)